MKNYGNIVTRYDDMLYDSRPATFNEFISDKYNKVHSELYNSALNKFYKGIVNKLINSEFIYELFNLISNTYSFDDVYNKYNELSYDHIFKQTLGELSIDTFKFLNDIYDKTCELLEVIKNELKSEEDNHSKYFDNFISVIDDFRITYSLNNTYLSQEDDTKGGEEFLTYHYIKDNNSDIITFGQPIEEYLFISELKDYVILLGADTGTRISYKNNGEWFLILDGDRYNTSSSKYYVVNFINKTNRNLINYIINTAIEYYKNNHRVIEIKNSEYWMPSSIIVVSNIKPYKKHTYSLEKYWNMNQGYNDSTIYDVKVTKENINDSELIEINYVTGIAKVRSRINDLEYNVSFKYLDDNVVVSEEMTLQNTFTNKRNKN